MGYPFIMAWSSIAIGIAKNISFCLKPGLILNWYKVSLSKLELAKLAGVNPNSIQKWRRLYEQGGLDNLLTHKTTASRPSVFTEHEKAQIESKLKDPNNGFQGYKELHIWVTEVLKKEVKPNTLRDFLSDNND